VGLRFNLAMNQKSALVLSVLLGAALNSFAQTNSAPGAPTEGIVAATKKILATLDDAQRRKVVFDFKDEAQRKRWSNLPTAIFKRQGLRMGDLTRPQRERWGGGSGLAMPQKAGSTAGDFIPQESPYRDRNQRSYS
jgi:uncharacterized protein DUF3500